MASHSILSGGSGIIGQLQPALLEHEMNGPADLFEGQPVHGVWIRDEMFILEFSKLPVFSVGDDAQY